MLDEFELLTYNGTQGEFHRDLDLKFHFENKNENELFIKAIDESCTGFRNLTIVGYSFPEENLELDSKIMNIISNGISNIYIKELHQDNYEKIKDKLTDRYNFNSQIIKWDKNKDSFRPNNFR